MATILQTRQKADEPKKVELPVPGRVDGIEKRPIAGKMIHMVSEKELDELLRQAAPPARTDPRRFPSDLVKQINGIPWGRNAGVGAKECSSAPAAELDDLLWDFLTLVGNAVLAVEPYVEAVRWLDAGGGELDATAHERLLAEIDRELVGAFAGLSQWADTSIGAADDRRDRFRQATMKALRWMVIERYYELDITEDVEPLFLPLLPIYTAGHLWVGWSVDPAEHSFEAGQPLIW